MNLKNKKILVFGGAGFIGSHLTERLVREGASVTVYDNLKTGRTANLAQVWQRPGFRFVEGDVREKKQGGGDRSRPRDHFSFLRRQRHPFSRRAPGHLCRTKEHGSVLRPGIHAQARNPPYFISEQHDRIRRAGQPAGFGVARSHDSVDLVWRGEACCGGADFGLGPPYDLQAVVFRFVGIIGGRMDHGVVHDFVRKLQKDPTQLEILGDGTQRRSFVLVDDCVEAMLFAFAKAEKNYNLVHIGNVDQISINETAEVILQVMKLKSVKLHPTGGKVGWKGDVISNFITTETLSAWGWKQPRSSREAVLEAAGRLALERSRE